MEFRSAAAERKVVIALTMGGPTLPCGILWLYKKKVLHEEKQQPNDTTNADTGFEWNSDHQQQGKLSMERQLHSPA